MVIRMTNLFDLTDSCAIVTGGTHGLGHGMAEGLMESGASVVIFSSSDKAEKDEADFRAHSFDCKIINIASMCSFFGGSTIPAYSASKGGVAQLTKAMCNDWAKYGITVNAIAPGYMDTPMNTALTDPLNPRFKEISDRIPAGRWGTGDDMKGLTIFLASKASDYVNGAIIPCDGGYLVK